MKIKYLKKGPKSISACIRALKELKRSRLIRKLGIKMRKEENKNKNMILLLKNPLIKTLLFRKS
jgi:hypothetical protein